MAEQPTGTVTLLFTDIEGSTQLLERLGPQRYAEALGLHRLLLRREFEVHGGYEVDYEGDAFFVAFARAADAVAAASDGQIALAHADWPDGQEIRVRMGIHTGEPLAAPPKYVGLDVHKAARIMAAGHGGQVLLSEATTRLLDGAETVGLGEHRLKDLLQAEPLYQLVVAGLPSVFPALKTLGNRPTNLPVQPNPLIGRKREVGDLVALLRAREVRLVTLTGPGGTGKTRLALQGAAEVMDDFPSGVFFVSLAPIRVADLVLPSIARALAVREVPGEEIAESVAAYLESKQMLLVLDNFEQVVDAAAQLEALQQRAPKLTLLVTSRERLRLKSERTYSVSPLTVADPALSVAELCENEAVALFIARARALTGEFALSKEGMAAVAEITARLDGLPLAIELAAARTTSLTPQALLRRLDQRLPLLTGGARDADERQRTLRATIDWSYELLGVPEQELSARLSVFVDGCRIDAVEAVCDLDGKLGIDLLDRLSGLVEKSLLRHRADPDQEPRYWMLETIREYAAGLLRPSAEEELRRRHADHYLALAERAEPHLWVGPEEAWFPLLDSEQANFRKVLEWLTVQEEATGVLRLATALYRYWEIRARYTEAIGWLTGGLTLGGDSISTELRAQALMGIGRAARFQCDWRVATESLEESAAYFRELQDERESAAALAFWGTCSCSPAMSNELRMCLPRMFRSRAGAAT
jgi:predicted ATPase/class 3 adenylate cyclase